MAQLTWRNVDTPTFSGVTESQRLSADLLNQGLNAARSSIKNVQDQLSKEDSALLQARVMSFTDPGALDAAQRSGKLYEGLDFSNLTPAAMEFVGGRPATLLSNIRTGVQTEGDRLTNIRTGVLTEGDRIQNVGYGLDNTKKSVEIEDATYKLGKTKEYEAARPAAIALLNKAQSLMTTGNPADRAAGIKLITDNPGILTAAGMKEEDSAKLFKDLSDTSKSGIEIDDAGYKLGKTKEYEAARPAAMNYLNRVKALMASGKPGDYQAGLKLMEEAGPVLAAAGMKREDYESIYTKLESGAQGSITTLDSADKRAKAVDTEARQQAANTYTDNLAASSRSYEDALRKIQDDPNITSEEKTLAAQTLTARKEALFGATPDVEQIIQEAVKSEPDRIRAGETPVAGTQEDIRATENEATDITNQGQALADAITTDTQLDRSQPYLEAFTAAPQYGSSLDAANALKEKFMKDQPGLFKDFDAGDAQEAIDSIMDRYPNINLNLATKIVENNMVANRQAWATGNRSLDFNAVEKDLKSFFGTDDLNNSDKLQRGATMRQTQYRAKSYVAQKAQQLQANVTRTREEYLKAVDRHKSRPDVDIEGPRLAYKAALAAAKQGLALLDKHPSVRAATTGNPYNNKDQ